MWTDGHECNDTARYAFHWIEFADMFILIVVVFQRKNSYKIRLKVIIVLKP